MTKPSTCHINAETLLNTEVDYICPDLVWPKMHDACTFAQITCDHRGQYTSNWDFCYLGTNTAVDCCRHAGVRYLAPELSVCHLLGRRGGHPNASLQHYIQHVFCGCGCRTRLIIVCFVWRSYGVRLFATMTARLGYISKRLHIHISQWHADIDCLAIQNSGTMLREILLCLTERAHHFFGGRMERTALCGWKDPRYMHLLKKFTSNSSGCVNATAELCSLPI